jgi:hypothetical protein
MDPSLSRPRLRLLAFLFLVRVLHAQCSDAGACAAGRATPGPGSHLALSYQAGASGSSNALDFRGWRLDANWRIGAATRLSLAVPYVRVEGPLGRVEGLGDAVLLVEQVLLQDEAWSLSAQVGSRLATGRDDADPALPQAYQTGLGPSDWIAGLRAHAGAWAAGLVYQKAGGRNANPLTRLKRGDDVLAWASRGLAWGRTRLTFKGLAIQRLAKSSVRAADGGPEAFRDVPESHRLQVNLGLEASRPWTRSLAWTGRAEFPLLGRPTNVDGLKRAWSVSAGVAWTF